MKRGRIYVDMDGVVADFNKKLYELAPELNEMPLDLKADYIDHICTTYPTIFHELEPIEGAIDAVKRLDEYYEVYFLSTPMWHVPLSFTGKRIWLEQHFGAMATKKLILTHRKDLNIGDYLIDDRLKHGVDKFEGVHIHFGTRPFMTWDDVLCFFKLA